MSVLLYTLVWYVHFTKQYQYYTRCEVGDDVLTFYRSSHFPAIYVAHGHKQARKSVSVEGNIIIRALQLNHNDCTQGSCCVVHHPVSHSLIIISYQPVFIGTSGHFPCGRVFGRADETFQERYNALQHLVLIITSDHLPSNNIYIQTVHIWMLLVKVKLYSGVFYPTFFGNFVTMLYRIRYEVHLQHKKAIFSYWSLKFVLWWSVVQPADSLPSRLIDDRYTDMHSKWYALSIARSTPTASAITPGTPEGIYIILLISSVGILSGTLNAATIYTWYTVQLYVIK